MVHYWNESPRVREERSDTMKSNERAMIRKRAGLTQHRLARLTGICASTISLWENHELELAPEAVEKIGRVIALELNRTPSILTATETVKVLAPRVVGAQR